MEERQVTVDGTTYSMHHPYMVVATQNPIEHEGTYRLPEAQLDRFLFKIQVDYPNLEQEVAIIGGHHQRKGVNPTNNINAVLSAEQIGNYRQVVQQLYMEDHLLNILPRSFMKREIVRPFFWERRRERRLLCSMVPKLMPLSMDVTLLLRKTLNSSLYLCCAIASC